MKRLKLVKVRRLLRFKYGLTREAAEEITKLFSDQIDVRQAEINELKQRRFKLPTLKNIVGALNCCIDSHGPITKDLIGSVTKRIEGIEMVETKQ